VVRAVVSGQREFVPFFSGGVSVSCEGAALRRHRFGGEVLAVVMIVSASISIPGSIDISELAQTSA
jgi:hypothetical protein